MHWFDWILCGNILIIGFICSVSDIRQNIISNRWIALGICISLIFQVFSIWNNRVSNLPYWIIIIFISCLISFIIYAGGYWAAGDVKFYIMMVLSVPAWIFEDTYDAAIIPYIYVFLLAAIYFVIDTVNHRLKKAERYSMEHITLKDITGYFKTMVCISVWRRIVFLLFPSFCQTNPLILVVLQFVMVVQFKRYHTLQSNILLGIHVLFWLITVIVDGAYFSVDAIRSWIIIAVVLLSEKEAASYNYTTIKTSEVKKGTVLSYSSIMMMQKSRIKNLPRRVGEDLTAKLTEEEATAVKRWAASPNGQENVVIVRKIPFGVFIWLGFIFFLVVKMKGI